MVTGRDALPVDPEPDDAGPDDAGPLPHPARSSAAIASRASRGAIVARARPLLWDRLVDRGMTWGIVR
jgi:hypothetical protein